ncbi:4'-phosphopantetheinyl transferase superfamily protein [Streptomyces sp. NPDC026665]|uniref:4'-phosphopantetheinyl transferase family protein n=1 Tax=Streptomyces sp. NPDC026665 TaxID=3154798 RepID=UPI0033E98213
MSAGADAPHGHRHRHGRDRAPAAPLAAPVHVPGPDGPWEQVQEHVEETGRAVVHTTWGQWLTPALLDPGLRALLGRDWPRYRQHPAPAGRLVLAVSRMVLKHTAAAVLQVPAHRLDLATLPGGRPVLRGLGADLQVSLAHTDELIVAGVSRTGRLGVDAEPAGRRISFEALREHVCTAEEARLLATLPEEERAQAFLRLWTLKEAYVKALGHGMRHRFPAVGFTWDATPTARLTEDTGDTGDTEGQWAFATHLVDGRYLVSQAHQQSEPHQQGEPHHSGEAHHQGEAYDPGGARPVDAALPQPDGPRVPPLADGPYLPSRADGPHGPSSVGGPDGGRVLDFPARRGPGQR